MPAEAEIQSTLFPIHWIGLGPGLRLDDGVFKLFHCLWICARDETYLPGDP